MAKKINNQKTGGCFYLAFTVPDPKTSAIETEIEDVGDMMATRGDWRKLRGNVVIQVAPHGGMVKDYGKVVQFPGNAKIRIADVEMTGKRQWPERGMSFLNKFSGKALTNQARLP